MKEYFSHDFNARNDKKIISLIMKCGLEGLGAFWCIVEMLYEESGYLKIEEYERITFELRSNNDLIKSVIFDFDLFKNDGEKFWSESVLERLKLRMDKSEKARQSVEKRWGKYERNTNVLGTKNERNTSKVKKSKVKKSKVFIKPTIEEVKQYFSENGYLESVAIKAFNYYDIADWHDSNDKAIKNWKQKMQSVWFKEENKIKQNNESQSEKMPEHLKRELLRNR